tara:strand:- start:6194 stop:6946 length:753 start_codon:yes stop_codon:yes gene_type:complete
MFKKTIYSLFFMAILTSCGGGEEYDFTLNGKINGLKKGTIYLQKVEDTLLIDLDSLVVEGNPEFEFHTLLKEPQVLYLYLDKVDASNYDDRILFFAEPGVMTLSTSLKNFESQAAITGSQNQNKLEEYKTMLNKFNNRNLELIQKSFLARKNEVEDSIMFYDDQLEKLTVRKYLYTVNFALQNKELEIAPYLAVSEIYDANVKYLDTIYNSLSRKAKKSRYGTNLKDLIDQAKSSQAPQVVEKTVDTISR